jgi:hypothetical protein
LPEEDEEAADDDCEPEGAVDLVELPAPVDEGPVGAPLEGPVVGPVLPELDAFRQDVLEPWETWTVALYCCAPVESLIPRLTLVPTGRSTTQVSEVASVWSNCL